MTRSNGLTDRILITLFLLLVSLRVHADEGAPEVFSGEIEGALYSVVKPAQWNGKLFIYAHGLRAEGTPLRAGLGLERPLYSTLLSDGWMAATTSYRRNGVIIADAIKDLQNLRTHIINEHGKPKRTVLMGNSMGGIIGTLIAERHADEFDAVLAAGAALRLGQRAGVMSLSHDPKIPIIFLTNRSEIEGPADYVNNASEADVPPALWRVERDGHVNVNDSERLAALAALEQWLDGGTIERIKDGTIEMAAESTAIFSSGAVEGRIAGVSASHGNIFTSLTPADLEQAGIAVGDRFSLKVNGHEVSVLFGTNYRDVDTGEWVGIMRAEGVLMIAQNFANACEAIDCKTGDEIRVTPEPGSE